MPCSRNHAPGYTLCSCCHDKYATSYEIEKHENEILRRKRTLGDRWFAVMNGHMLHDGEPANDKNFIYGQAPNHKDGTINGPGVYSDPTIYALELQQQHLHQQDRDRSQEWICRHVECGKRVDKPPREFMPGPKRQKEPVDWWWCDECRANKKKPSMKQQANEIMAGKCHKIEHLFEKKKKL